MTVFSRVGVPREVLSDRGAQFTSDLMNEIHKLIGNKQMNDMKVSALRTENKRLKTEYEKLEEKYDNLELENNYCKDKLNDIESENDQFKANGQKNALNHQLTMC